MALIGISGKLQSGKNTTARIINQFTNNQYQEKSFAGKLKQIVSILTGIPVEDLEKQEVKDTYLSEEWLDVCYKTNKADETTNFKNKSTYRELLQVLGTEAMRDVIHTNCWVNALFADYKPFIKNYPDLIKSNGKNLIEGNSYSMGKAILPNWIITDVRFPNEVEAIKNRGGITIRVNRNDKVSTIIEKQEGQLVSINHRSETVLDNAEFDYIIENDSTIEQLIEKVKEILIKEKII